MLTITKHDANKTEKFFAAHQRKKKKKLYELRCDMTRKAAKATFISVKSFAQHF